MNSERHKIGSSIKGFDKKCFILSLLVVIICTCLLRFPPDDGLRHVGLAFVDLRSGSSSMFTIPQIWGKVYPYSYFEVYNDYNPWFGYDLALKITATGLKSLPISTLLSQFLLIKMLSLLFSLAFFYLILARSGILGDIKDQDTFTLAYVILLVLSFYPFIRMLCIRPFAFGTLFLLYTIGQKGILRGMLSSAALTFFYPYLAWFYTIPVSLAHFLKGDRRLALGIISLTILFLYLQPSSFWGFQLALFKSDLVRALINPKVGEFFSILNLTFFIYLSGFLISYPSISRKAKKLSVKNLLIILYLIPSFKYNRYFLDLVLPLLFVSFARELLIVLLEPYQKFTSYLRLSFTFWKNTILSSLKKLKLSRTRMIRERVNINLKPYLVVLYVIVSILVIQLNHKEFSSLREFQADLSVIPTGSTLLTHFDLQYKILYVRPDLRIIPSCEIGFPKDSIRKEYVDFLNEGEFLSLARKTNARFLLERKNMYINPKNGGSLRLVRKSNDLRIWKVLHSPE